MWFEAVLFFLAGIGVLAGALGVVMLRNPFYSVLGLVVHLIALAVLFLLLDAQFLAAAQVVVYAGAVMVLYVFVVAYIGGVREPFAMDGVVGQVGRGARHRIRRKRPRRARHARRRRGGHLRHAEADR